MRNRDEKPGIPTSLPSMDLNDHFASTMASLRNTFLGFLAVFALYPSFTDYPAYGAAKTFNWVWMKPIILRNIVGTLVVCGIWEWFLYFSPFHAKMFKYKFTPVYPSYRQMARDMVVTLQG